MFVNRISREYAVWIRSKAKDNFKILIFKCEKKVDIISKTTVPPLSCYTFFCFSISSLRLYNTSQWHFEQQTSKNVNQFERTSFPMHKPSHIHSIKQYALTWILSHDQHTHSKSATGIHCIYEHMCADQRWFGSVNWFCCSLFALNVISNWCFCLNKTLSKAFGAQNNTIVVYSRRVLGCVLSVRRNSLYLKLPDENK